MSDASFLRSLGCFRLSLRGRGHKGDHRIPNGLLDRIGRRSIKTSSR
jgi:hypothetical protein